MRVALQGEQPQAKGAAEGERESCATRAGDVFAFGLLGDDEAAAPRRLDGLCGAGACAIAADIDSYVLSADGAIRAAGFRWE